MPSIEYMKGTVFAKKVGDKVQIFEGSGLVEDESPVLATGTATPRMLKDRFADVVNVRDFGAKGDGVTDDTAAFESAFKRAGGGRVYLGGGTYRVSNLPKGINITGGYVLCAGKLINADGAAISQNAKLGQKKLCSLPILDDSGRVFPNSTWAAQGLTYLNIDGQDKIFMVVRTFGVEYPYSHQMCTIAEYDLLNDGTASFVQATGNLPIGHGQGLGARYVDGHIYIYAQEAGYPERSTDNNLNYGKGFTITDYKGSATTAADVISYKLMPTYSENSHDNRVNSRVLTPTIAPDGKTLIAFDASRVYGWNLEDILKCTTEEVGIVEDTYPDSGYVKPSKYIDATSVFPIFEWGYADYKTNGHQAIACDARYIYISSGIGNPSISSAVSVFTYSGEKVKDIYYGGSRGFYTESELLGETSRGILTTNENEGIFVRGDEICTLMVARWRDAADVVSYNGKNYACISDTSTNPPDSFGYGEWVLTNLSPTKGEWKDGVSYTGASETTTENAEQEQRIVCSISFLKDEYISLDTNGLIVDPTTYLKSPIFTIPKGGSFSVNYLDPYTGEYRIKASFDNRNMCFYSLDSDDVFVHTYAKFQKSNEYFWIRIDKGGVDRNSAQLTFYGDTETGIPNSIEIASKNGASLARFTNNGVKLRLGGSYAKDGISLSFVSDSQATDVAKMWYSTSHVYLGAVGKNMQLCRFDVEEDGSWTQRATVGVYANMLAPFTDNAYNLGSSGLRFGNVYAATGTINTSDERAKTDVAIPQDALLNALRNVDFRLFRFKDSVEKKGDAARIHAGVVAQEVQAAFASQGLNAADYGLFCYDEWGDEYEDVEVVDQPEVLGENGEVVTPAVTHTERRKVLDAGNRYGIRYTELLALTCASLAKRLDKIEKALVLHGINLE